MQDISNSAVFAGASLMSDKAEENSQRAFTLDTTFVLFFLALDLGNSWLNFGLDGFLAGLTLAVFAVVPYFLFDSETAPDFRQWLTGRVLVAAAGVSFGLMLRQSVGILLPDAARYLPMTLLIVAAIICCNVQIYAILKNRLAR